MDDPLPPPRGRARPPRRVRPGLLLRALGAAMDLRQSLWAFTALVLAVGGVRLVELAISERRRRALAARGARPVAERHFAAMVLLHAGILAGAVAEAWLVRRPLVLAVAVPSLVLLAAASALRWWVIA